MFASRISMSAIEIWTCSCGLRLKVFCESTPQEDVVVCKCGKNRTVRGRVLESSMLECRHFLGGWTSTVLSKVIESAEAERQLVNGSETQRSPFKTYQKAVSAYSGAVGELCRATRKASLREYHE